MDEEHDDEFAEPDDSGRSGEHLDDEGFVELSADDAETERRSDDHPVDSDSEGFSSQDETEVDVEDATAAAFSEDSEPDEDDLDGLSLDDLGAAYARVAAEHDPEAFAPPPEEEARSVSLCT